MTRRAGLLAVLFSVPAPVLAQPLANRPIQAVLMAADVLLGETNPTAPADVVQSASSRRAREVGRNFYRCVVRRHADLARAVVLNDLSQSQIDKYAHKLEDKICFDAASSGINYFENFQGESFLYGLASAIVNVDYPSMPGSSFVGVKLLSHRQYLNISKSSLGEYREQIGQYGLKLQDRETALDGQLTNLSVFGECAARDDPGAAYRLIKSDPGSTEERIALDLLSSSLKRCWLSQRVMPQPEIIAGTIAVSFYRLAGAPSWVAVADLHMES